MGWAHCGTDSDGREIGYAVEATCDHPGCEAKIDRGLSYACGGMHGEEWPKGGGICCEKYFCSAHLCLTEMDGEIAMVCPACNEEIERQMEGKG